MSRKPCLFIEKVSFLASMSSKMPAVLGSKVAITKSSTCQRKITCVQLTTPVYRQGWCVVGARPISCRIALVCYSHRCRDSGRDDVAIRHWWTFLMIHSPVKESFVWYDLKALFRRRSLSKCFGNICTENQEVLSRWKRIENPGTHLIHTVGICLIKDTGWSGAWQTIASALCFVPSVKSFNSISPHHTKYSSTRVDFHRISKHPLYIILIQLNIFWKKPFVPVRLLDEFSTGEFHYPTDDIQDHPIIYNLVRWIPAEMIGHSREFSSVVELVVYLLSEEWGRRHNG